MTWETIEIAGKICRIAAADSPVCVLIQPTGEQLVPPQFGWTAGQNMLHCIVLRHRTSTLVLEPKNTKPETRCCER